MPEMRPAPLPVLLSTPRAKLAQSYALAVARAEQALVDIEMRKNDIKDAEARLAQAEAEVRRLWGELEASSAAQVA